MIHLASSDATGNSKVILEIEIEVAPNKLTASAIQIDNDSINYPVPRGQNGMIQSACVLPEHYCRLSSTIAWVASKIIRIN